MRNMKEKSDLCDQKMLDNKHLKWFTDSILPALCELATCNNQQCGEVHVVHKLIFRFMDETKIFNELDDNINDEHWETFMYLIMKFLVPPNPNEYFDEDGNGPHKDLYERFDNIDTKKSAKLSIDKVHEILSSNDTQWEPGQRKYMIKQVMCQLLQSASPKVYKLRLSLDEENMFVKLAIKFYLAES